MINPDNATKGTSMRPIRLLLCALPLLAACASTPPKHASIPPASQPAQDNGIAGLTASTPVTLAAIGDKLGASYRLLEGMEIRDGTPSPYIEAHKNGKLALQIHGTDRGITRIDIYDPSLGAANGVKIGTPFARLYQHAFNVCQRPADLTPGILCQAPDDPHLIYLFSGSESTSSLLIPDDNTLKDWTISRITWQSQSVDR